MVIWVIETIFFIVLLYILVTSYFFLLLLGPYCFCPLLCPSLHKIFPWYHQFSWGDLYSFTFYCFPLFLCIDPLGQGQGYRSLGYINTSLKEWGTQGEHVWNGCTMLGLVAQSCPTLCSLMDCSPPGSSVHAYSPGKNTGVGCHALLQGIFPAQESNPALPHCRQILYCLSLQWSPVVLWVAPKFNKQTEEKMLMMVVSKKSR